MTYRKINEHTCMCDTKRKKHENEIKNECNRWLLMMNVNLVYK